MLLLSELTSAPDNKSTGIEYCQKISEKVLPVPISILHMKSIDATQSPEPPSQSRRRQSYLVKSESVTFT